MLTYRNMIFCLGTSVLVLSCQAILCKQKTLLQGPTPLSGPRADAVNSAAGGFKRVPTCGQRKTEEGTQQGTLIMAKVRPYYQAPFV